jgi:hypothetical protein
LSGSKQFSIALRNVTQSADASAIAHGEKWNSQTGKLFNIPQQPHGVLDIPRKFAQRNSCGPRMQGFLQKALSQQFRSQSTADFTAAIC